MRKHFSLIIIFVIINTLSACQLKQTEVLNEITNTKIPYPSVSIGPSVSNVISPTVVPTITGKLIDSANLSFEKQLLDKIIEKNSSYEQYDVDVISDDFDENGKDEYFYIFTKAGTSKEEFDNYCVDIWFGNRSGVTEIIEGEDIQTDTYGVMKLAGKKYFRYDLTYATSCQTNLLSVVNNKCINVFHPPGYIERTNENEFSLTYDCYDLLYMKDEGIGISVGHTRKPYYFYADNTGIHEYGAKVISKAEFLKYQGSDKILNKLKSEFKKKNNKITFQFLRRSNGLLHINIFCRSKDEIENHYKTYEVIKNKLKLYNDSYGEGTFKTELMKEIAVY